MWSSQAAGIPGFVWILSMGTEVPESFRSFDLKLLSSKRKDAESMLSDSS